MSSIFGLRQNNHSVSINPSIVYVVVGTALGFYFLYRILPIVFLLFLAFIVMTAVRPQVQFLHAQLKLPKFVSISLVYLALIALVSGIFGLVVPPLLSELQAFTKGLDAPFVNGIVGEIKNFRLTFESLGSLVQSVGNPVQTVWQVLSSAFATLFNVIAILILSVYLLIDREHLHQRFAWLSKEKKHIEVFRDILDTIERDLGGWVRGQVQLMLLIGIITYLSLLVLGVPYALPLAVIAGVLEIVPNIGPSMAAVPAVILGFASGGVPLGMLVLGLYILVQQLENNLLVPKIMEQNVDVSPLATIVSILIGLQLGSVLGAFLAVPVYIVLRTCYSFLRNQD